jgi:SAM-dependent methyltransferase
MVAHARLSLPAPARAAAPVFGGGAARAAVDQAICSRLDAALLRLHEDGRHAIRILDAGCGPGNWLLRVALRARDMGFTAIEGIGIDTSPEMIAFAEAQRSLAEDAHIGLRFDVAEIATALDGEEDASFDILLCLGDGLGRLSLRQRDRAVTALARVADGDLFAMTLPGSLFPPVFHMVERVELASGRLLLHARIEPLC